MATLPSSPPQLTRSRSRSPSDYSLDLDALMPPDESSEIMTPPRKSHIDVVHSEDIDGPTDFTQNLEYWMTAKLPTVTRPSHIAGQAKHDLEAYVSGNTVLESPQHDQREKDSLLDSETPRKESDNDDMSFMSNVPSSLRANDTESSTPRTVEYAPARKELQASVEDHDDTPSKIRGSSSAIGAELRSPEIALRPRPVSHIDGGHKELHEESETVRSLRETLTRLREELEEVRLRGHQELGRMREDHEWHAKQQEAAHSSELQEQERAWQQRMTSTKAEFEKQMLNARVSQPQNSSHTQDSRVPELEGQLAAREHHITQLQSTIDQQNHKLQSAQQEIGRTRRDLSNAEEKYRLASEDHLRQHSQAEERYRSLRDGYGKLEASNSEAKAKFEALQAEFANVKLEHTNEMDNLTIRIDDAANATQRAVLEERKASQTAVSELEYENARLHTHLDNKDDEIDALKDELFQLTQRTSVVSEEKEKLAVKLKEQKDLNDKAAREIQSLRSGSKILRSRLDDTSKTESSAIEALEQRLAEANASRLEADAEADAAKAEALARSNEAEVARAELTRLKEDSALVNAAMDKRMRDVMRAREALWAKRIEVLRQEMGFRGEVLMREWGVKEMGISEPQAYRYKYV